MGKDPDAQYGHFPNRDDLPEKTLLVKEGKPITKIRGAALPSRSPLTPLIFLVVRQITRSNPAHSVRGPKYVVKKGKTPVWSGEDAKTLLESIPKDSVSGLRDLALIAAMFYSFARVSAVLKELVSYCAS
jgi:hypothetical protein